jgi:Flp pilus assembly protein TadD
MAHHYIGKVLTEQHQLPEAVQELSQALQFAPEDARIQNDLGVALYQIEDYENAADHFSEAVRINPAYADARRNLDLAQARMKSKK